VPVKKRIFPPRGVFLRFFCIAALTASQAGFALSESAAAGGCNVRAVHDLGYRGEGVKIGLLTAHHARASHEAFFDKSTDGNSTGDFRVFILDATDHPLYEPDWHDTPIAGILAGRGGSGPYAQHLGMAPAADVYNTKVTQSDPADPSGRQIEARWLEAALDQLACEGVRAVASGFQIIGAQADGQSVYTLLYDHYADRYDIVFANAAGNATTGVSGVSPFGDGYNGITVAGLVDETRGDYVRVGRISNSGPTADGRRKPDLAAPGKSLQVPGVIRDSTWVRLGHSGETSWAGPHVAGCAAVLIGYADTTPDPDDGRSEVIKAVLVNSAFADIHDKDDRSTAGQTWNEQRGYGRIDALRAFETLCGERITPLTTAAGDKGWAYQVMNAPGGEDRFRILGRQGQRLRTTLTWHRRVIKNGPLDYAPEPDPFNLDLTITDPAGRVIFAETDTLNNLEKADLRLEADGIYEIGVRSTTRHTGRDYALAFEIVPIP
jgi:hypothetical protein